MIFFKVDMTNFFLLLILQETTGNIEKYKLQTSLSDCNPLYQQQAFLFGGQHVNFQIVICLIFLFGQDKNLRHSW